jgi:hypothetical protein
MALVFVAACLTPGVNSFFSVNHSPTTAVLLQAVAVGVVVGAVIDGLSRVRIARRFTDVEDVNRLLRGSNSG